MPLTDEDLKSILSNKLITNPFPSTKHDHLSPNKNKKNNDVVTPIINNMAGEITSQF